MSLQLNPRQLECLDRGHLISVSAGAGSGKTRVLVERYLRLLGIRADPDRPRYRPDEIVAITFTRKAAAEIKGRIREELLALRGDADAEAAALADQALEHLVRARVGTIDSFFAEVLREYSLEAGLDPGFTVLQEQERGWLEEEALGELLRDVIGGEDAAARAGLELLLDAFGSRYAVEARIRVLLRDRSAMDEGLARGTAGLEEDWRLLQERARGEVLEELARDTALRALAPDLERLAAAAPPEDALADKLRVAQAALEALADPQGRERAAASLAGLLEAFLTAAGQPRGLGRAGAKARWKADPAALEEARGLGAALAEVLAGYGQARDMELDPGVEHDVAQVAAALLRLAAGTAARYRVLAGRKGAVDFQDLSEGVGRLLDGPEAPRILGALRARHRVFLLDEMQDTNRQQWSMLRRLVLEAEAEAPPESFLVGDPKQAIYSFRRADVRAFLEAVEDLGGENRRRGLAAGERSLPRNYRSAPRILDFVNDVFGRLMAEPDGGFEVPFQELEAGRADLEGRVGLLLDLRGAGGAGDAADSDARDDPGCEPDLAEAVDDEPPEVREAEFLARKIFWLVEEERSFGYGEVAILLRRRQPLADIERALRAWGVPYRVFGGVGFYQRQEIRDLVSVLRVLVDRGDDLALAAVLRSPLVGLEDEGLFHLALLGRQRGLWDNLERACSFPPGWWEEGLPSPDSRLRATLAWAHGCLVRWRDMAGRLPTAALLRTMAAEVGLWASLRARADGDQAAENVEKLIDTVRGLQGDLAEVTRYLVRLVEQEDQEGDAPVHLEDSDQVKIMTVHAAKGLEFPAVFVPDLSRELRPRVTHGLLTDPDGFLAFGAPDWLRQGRERPQSFAYRHALRRRRLQERAEEKRLFYVACTRASRALYLAGRIESWKELPEGGGSRWVDWLRRLLRLDPDACAAGEVRRGPVVVGIESDPAQVPVSEREAPGEKRRVLDTLDLRRLPDLGPPPAEALRALAPVVATRPPDTLSPTKLMDLACPRYFHFRHVLGIDPTERARLLGRRAHPTGGRGAVLGSAVHRALEGWARAPEDPGAWGHELEVSLREQSRLDEAAREQVRAAAAEMIGRFLDSELSKRIRASRQVHVEQIFSLPMAGTVLTGAIDMVYQDREHGWVVLDWKTNSPPAEGPLDAWLEVMEARYRPQLLCYALALRERRNLRPGFGAALHFLRPGVTWRARIEADELDRFQARIEAQVERVAARRFRRDDALEPVTPARCGGCPYQAVCPESRAEES